MDRSRLSPAKARLIRISLHDFSRMCNGRMPTLTEQPFAMNFLQQEEDLILALALSNSQEQNNYPLISSRPEVGSDDQSLAFFTDIPFDYKTSSCATNDEPSSNTSSHLSRKEHVMLESDMSYARGLQDQEDYKRLTEEESQIARDCELAAELSASEVKSFSNSSSSLPSLSARGASFYTRQRNRNTCSYCSKSLVGEHKIVEQELLLHHHCFLCAGCGQPIAQSYSKRGDVADGTVEFYHPACSLELFSPRCDLCNDKLSRQYKTHGFFTEKQKYCTRHDIRNHRACTSCNLLEPLAGRGEGFSSLPDGRVICPECVCVIILESSEAQGLYLDAVAFMENSLGMRIPPYMREVPVLAVDLPSLNDQSSLNRHLCGAHPPVKLPSQPGGSNDNSTGHSSSITRGLTISTTTSVRHLSHGALSWNALTSSWKNRNTPGGGTGSLVTLRHHTSVTAVLVLCGLTKTLTSSILAHEAMHVWLRLQQLQGSLVSLPPAVEEGVCQLIASQYLQNLSSTSSTNSSPPSWSDRLRPYYLYQIETDPCPVYGGGFRQAAGAYAALGLHALLDHIMATGQFPAV